MRNLALIQNFQLCFCNFTKYLIFFLVLSSEVDSLITGVMNFFLQFWTSHACWFLPSLFPPFPSILVSFVGPRSLCVFVSLFLVTLLRLGFFSFNSPDGN